MKLYCIIHDKRYEIVEGATFSEEYNETLDSGSIILDQEPKIENLEPFDDVYIYDEETNGELFYKHMLVDSFNEELNNVRFEHYKYKIQLFSETKRLEKVILPNISITQPVDKEKRRSVWEYLNVYLDLYSPQIKIIDGIREWKYDKKYSFSDFHDLPEGYQECEYLQSTGTQWTSSGIQIEEGDRLIIEFSDFIAEANKYVFGQNTGALYFQMLTPASLYWTDGMFDVSQHKTGNKWEFVFNKVPSSFNGYFNLFTTGSYGSSLAGKGKIYYVRHYRDNILVANLVPCVETSTGLQGFYDIEGQHFYPNEGTGDFLYKKRYKPEHFEFNSVHDLFDNVDAPEMTLTNPTLRDVISQLMLTKDCIPVVHDDVIDYIDVSLRHDTFIVDRNEEYINYIHSGMNSEDFSTEARREYSGALSQDSTCKMVEYLGFRDSNTPLLTRTGLVLETRYPIYKINKIYMCYYKQAQIYEEETGYQFVRFMCKQDITPLVVQNVVRQGLSMNYEDFGNLIGDGSNVEHLSIEELSKYKICTVGYDIGSNRITGWGEQYTYFNDTAYWFKSTQTILENIISFVDRKTPFGCKKAGVAFTNKDKQCIVSTTTSGLSSIDAGNLYSAYTELENASAKQKAVFFEVDYNAMFGGAIVHSKDYKDKDDLQTVDNCSSSLTVLEADGLFEKEKMNRLGNRQYNIQARYEGSNGYGIMNGQTCNHVLGSVLRYSDQDDDVVIYHREYQIYENIVLANFAGTFDYVLKNYFTSVYAKLRTYNLASYGESVKRAEIYKEYIVLNEEYATYEEHTLIDNYLDKYFSCFKPTVLNEENYNAIKNNQINFGYIQTKFNGSAIDIDKSRAFCDINTFCSGYSMCVNLKMYDNVTQGVYVKYPQKVNDNVIGSVQEWYIAVDDVEDPFQERMAFGFGHLYQDGDTIPVDDLDLNGNTKKPFIPEYGFDQSSTDTSQGYSQAVQDIYEQKLLPFPNFNGKQYIENNSAYTLSVGNYNGLVVYKDNKEAIDFTFQFETITNSKNVFFSSYFIKLNDMSGIYNRWEKSSYEDIDYGILPSLLFDGQLDFHPVMTSTGLVDRYKIVMYLTIPKSKFIYQVSPYNMYMKSENINLLKICYYFSPGRSDYYNFYFGVLDINQQNQMKIYYRRSETSFSQTGTSSGERNFVDLDSNLEIYQEDNTNYYLRFDLATELPYQVDFWNHEQLDNVVTFELQSSTANESADYLHQKLTMTKNMFTIVSSEKIKKEIIYDTYLCSYSWFLPKVRLGYEYELKDDGLLLLWSYNFRAYHDIAFDVNFTIKNLTHTVNREQVLYQFNRLYFALDGIACIVVENGEEVESVQICIYDSLHNLYWTNNDYKFITFSGGRDADANLFLQFLTYAIGLKPKNVSGIYINGLPDYMTIVNTDDVSNRLDSNWYIPFVDLFNFNQDSIPKIHVGNSALSNYPDHKSIQFWYLDNNGEGAGRLHFVFGVNTEENEKDVYVSVATRRSPCIYSDDHKHIIGSVKQMTATDYQQNNIMVPYQDVAPTIAIKDDTLTISTTSSVTDSYDVYVDNVFSQNITTTTFALSSLNLTAGTYAIKVKAKASIGLSDSEFSNVVEYVVSA